MFHGYSWNDVRWSPKVEFFLTQKYGEPSSLFCFLGRPFYLPLTKKFQLSFAQMFIGKHSSKQNGKRIYTYIYSCLFWWSWNTIFIIGQWGNPEKLLSNQQEGQDIPDIVISDIQTRYSRYCPFLYDNCHLKWVFCLHVQFFFSMAWVPSKSEYKANYSTRHGL